MDMLASELKTRNVVEQTTLKLRDNRFTFKGHVHLVDVCVVPNVSHHLNTEGL